MNRSSGKALIAEHEALLRREQELRARLDKEEAPAQKEGGDAAAQAFEDTAMELSTALRQRDLDELRRVTQAIADLQNGVAALCEDCMGPIPAARRQALAGVRTCVECQGKRENGTGNGHSSHKEHWGRITDGGSGIDHLEVMDYPQD